MVLETSAGSATELSQQHDEEAQTPFVSVDLSLSDGSNVVFATDSAHIDTFDSESLRVVLVGGLRSYGSDLRLSAADVAQRFESTMEALYPGLAGRFVLLIQDKRNNRIWLTNDHMGSLPCFYSRQDDILTISTSLDELVSRANTPPPISMQSIFNYCYFHCIPAPNTIYEGVSKLTPAELITISQGIASRSGTLYKPEFADAGSVGEAEHARCLAHIEDAVKYSATDDTAAFLSGGLDSSTVAGMLARIQDKAKTFSVGFKEPGYDETEYALITARHFGTDHDAAYLEPKYITDNFRKVASAFDEPFGNSSSMAAYFCASYAREKGVTRMLAGDGGDELFAGNSRYAKQKLFSPYESLPSWLKSLSRGVFVRSPLAKVPGIKKISSYIQQAENPLPDRLQAYNFLHRFDPKDIFTESFLQAVDVELPLQQLRSRYKDAQAQSATDKMLYLDWKFTLADNDLVKVAKMCELADVEVEFPLLEKELTDFSCTIPASAKLPGQKLRAFYKNAMKNFLADETLTKSKHGFGLPFGRWMRSTKGLVELTEQSLNNLKKRNIVKPEFIEQALRMQNEEHSAYYGELIWILTVLELWLESREKLS